MINSGKCYWDEWGGKRRQFLLCYLIVYVFKRNAIITFKIEKLI